MRARGLSRDVRPFFFSTLHVLLTLTLLTGIFALFIGGAGATGRGQLPSRLAQQLALTHCQLPCWLGIIPGETDYDGVYRQLTGVFTASLIQNPYDRLIGQTGTYDIYWRDLQLLPIGTLENPRDGVPLTITFQNTLAVHLQLYLDAEHPLMLGDVLLAYSEPSCVDPTSDSLIDGWTLYYLDETHEHRYTQVDVAGTVRGDANGLQLTSRVTSLIMSAEPSTGLPPCAPADHYPWQGMTYRWRYSEDKTSPP